MEEIMSQPLYENAFILKRPTVVNFADIIKIPTIIKKTFKESKKVKRIRNYVFTISVFLGIAKFPDFW